MGRDQRIIDELGRFQQLCLDPAEKSTVPGEAGALIKLAANHRGEAARRAVARTVDCSRLRLKSRAISREVDGHRFRQDIPITSARSRQPRTNRLAVERISSDARPLCMGLFSIFCVGAAQWRRTGPTSRSQTRARSRPERKWRGCADR